MNLAKTYPFYLGGEPVSPNQDLAVTDKYTGEIVTRVAKADRAAVEKAIALATEAAQPMRRLKPYQRQAILNTCVSAFEDRREELAFALCVEAGKPISDARGEVTRLIDTFRIAAEEAVRIGGEVIPLEISARATGYRGMTQRVPIGPCGFITPFNFPLNLVAHKVAPAIAAGCPFVLKPASATPLGALIIGEILSQTDLPKGAFSIVTASSKDAAPIVEDERIKLLSFTGSDLVGWELKKRAGKKKVHLELGGNAPVIVEPDADLDDAIKRIIRGAFYQSGQSCISVQRILIHDHVYNAFRDSFVSATKDLVAGDPKDEDTFIGPLIDEDAAQRIENWIGEAEQGGAKVLCGGTRKGSLFNATVIEDVPADAKLQCLEVFGPVAILQRYPSFDEAIRIANDTPYGLQAGLFTRDLYKAHEAWDQLVFGGVIVGDIPSWRVDNMPYGGIKASGLGREGPRYAIEEMTELRLLVIRDPEEAQ